MNTNKIDWKLIGFCAIAISVSCGIVGTLLAFAEKADAAEMEATARDVQRFNACTNRAIYSGFEKESEVIREAINCAAYGKAVSHIESAKGTSKWAKTRNNHYGIMVWDKNGKRHFRTFKTTGEADAKWAALWFDGYRKVSTNHRKFAIIWTAEPHIVKSYSAFLSKWVPTYKKLYSQFK